VRAASIQRETLVASLVLAGVVVAGAGLAGRLLLGVAVACGLVLGSLNSFVIKATLDRGAPILATSFVRLAMFTLLALAAARILGASVWPVVAGIAAAQLLMVGIGVRQGRQA
jgi:hypothetical protein